MTVATKVTGDFTVVGFWDEVKFACVPYGSTFWLKGGDVIGELNASPPYAAVSESIPNGRFSLPSQAVFSMGR